MIACVAIDFRVRWQTACVERIAAGAVFKADGRCAGRCDQRLKRVGSGVVAVGDARLRGGNGRSVGAQNRVRRERRAGRRIEHSGHQIGARRDERERARVLRYRSGGLGNEGREGDRRVGRRVQRALRAAERIGGKLSRAGRPRGAGCTRRAGRSLRALKTLRALNALRPRRADCALRSGRTGGTRRTLRALRALRSLRSLRAGRADGAVRRNGRRERRTRAEIAETAVLNILHVRDVLAALRRT